MLRTNLRHLYREVLRNHDQRYESRVSLIKMFTILEKMCRNHQARGEDVALTIIACVNGKCPTIAKRAFAMVQEGLVPYTSEVRCAQIRALALEKSSTDSDLEEVMNGVQTKDINIALINSLINYHRIRNDIQAIKTVVNHMKTLQIKPDEQFVIQNISISSSKDEIQGWVHVSEKNRVCTRNIIAKCIQRCAQLNPPLYDMALNLSKKIKNNLDTRCYNYLLQAAPSTDTVRSLLAEMSSVGISPNAATYQMAIKSSSDIELSTMLFHRAQAEGYSSSPYIYNSMVQCLLRHRHVREDIAKRVADVVALAKLNCAVSKHLSSLCRTIYPAEVLEVRSKPDIAI